MEKKISTHSLTYKCYVLIRFLMNADKIFDKDFSYKWLYETKFYIPANTCELWGTLFFGTILCLIMYSTLMPVFAFLQVLW